eukprot:CAMPEP_0196682180 /NCGR_PEP_ID=MMETSP1090-20130531/9045_1 /TAXON_ID=37098 /ORGANISM="Isochrysis sp, Strain CCMP1244" /LENGTH=217 /DNA_ID=CAMNT_0042020583 /DNA_START=52 /DNA_END=701 /DNA_ORIENTATION=-
MALMGGCARMLREDRALRVSSLGAGQGSTHPCIDRLRSAPCLDDTVAFSSSGTEAHACAALCRGPWEGGLWGAPQRRFAAFAASPLVHTRGAGEAARARPSRAGALVLAAWRALEGGAERAALVHERREGGGGPVEVGLPAPVGLAREAEEVAHERRAEQERPEREEGGRLQRVQRAVEDDVAQRPLVALRLAASRLEEGDVRHCQREEQRQQQQVR